MVAPGLARGSLVFISCDPNSHSTLGDIPQDCSSGFGMHMGKKIPGPWSCLPLCPPFYQSLGPTGHSQARLPLSSHVTLSPPRARERGRPRLTLQHEDHHFLHCAHLILCQAPVLSRVVHLQVGTGEGMWSSREEDEGQGSNWGQPGMGRGDRSKTGLPRKELGA